MEQPSTVIVQKLEAKLLNKFAEHDHIEDRMKIIIELLTKLSGHIDEFFIVYKPTYEGERSLFHWNDLKGLISILDTEKFDLQIDDALERYHENNGGDDE